MMAEQQHSTSRNGHGLSATHKLHFLVIDLTTEPDFFAFLRRR